MRQATLSLRPIEKLLFCIITQIVLFSAMEIVARLFPMSATKGVQDLVGARFPNEKVPRQWDDELFWTIIPNSVLQGTGDRINSRGFRTPEFASTPPPGTIRIACIGDSCAFGMSVVENLTFERRLERWLNSGRDSSSLRAEVLNLGIPGYSSYQILRQFENVVIGFKPHALVIYAGAWNDFAPAVRFDDRAMGDVVKARNASGIDLLFSSRLMTRVRDLFEAPTVESRPASEDYKDPFAADRKGSRAPRVVLSDFVTFLTAISERAKREGIPVVFIVPPAPSATRNRYPEGDSYAGAVINVATSRSDGIAPAREAFTKFGDDDTILYEDGIHPSAFGHSVIASLVAQELIRLRVVQGANLEPKNLVDSTPVNLGLILQHTAHSTPTDSKPNVNFEYTKDQASIRIECPGELETPTLQIKDGDSLQTTFAWIGPDANAHVEFEIDVLDGERSTLLFKDDVNAPALDEAGVRNRVVNLSAFAGSSVRFRFVVRGSRGTNAYWIRPRLISRAR